MHVLTVNRHDLNSTSEGRAKPPGKWMGCEARATHEWLGSNFPNEIEIFCCKSDPFNTSCIHGRNSIYIYKATTLRYLS